MPPPEEIKKIARRFELDMYPTMPDMLSAKAMLEWLSKDYCIVPKKKIAEWKGIVDDALKSDKVITERAFRFMWERLFEEEK